MTPQTFIAKWGAPNSVPGPDHQRPTRPTLAGSKRPRAMAPPSWRPRCGFAPHARVFGSGWQGTDSDSSVLDLLVTPQPGTTRFDLGGLQVLS